MQVKSNFNSEKPAKKKVRIHIKFGGIFYGGG